MRREGAGEEGATPTRSPLWPLKPESSSTEVASLVSFAQCGDAALQRPHQLCIRMWLPRGIPIGAEGIDPRNNNWACRACAKLQMGWGMQRAPGCFSMPLLAPTDFARCKVGGRPPATTCCVRRLQTHTHTNTDTPHEPPIVPLSRRSPRVSGLVWVAQILDPHRSGVAAERLLVFAAAPFRCAPAPLTCMYVISLDTRQKGWGSVRRVRRPTSVRPACGHTSCVEEQKHPSGRGRNNARPWPDRSKRGPPRSMRACTERTTPGPSGQRT